MSDEHCRWLFVALDECAAAGVAPATIAERLRELFVEKVLEQLEAEAAMAYFHDRQWRHACALARARPDETVQLGGAVVRFFPEAPP